MRKPFVAGNWKMNLAGTEAEALARSVVAGVKGVEGVEIGICPTFVALERVAAVVSGTNVGLGGQNMHWEADGAFTGEISASMLLTSGCRYVILGHSERRTFFGETDETVNKRLKAAQVADLTPIVCVGETLQERESDVTEKVVKTQVVGAFKGVSEADASSAVVAYEPVWAIGTGLTATPGQAEAVHAFIRQTLTDLYTPAAADAVRIQYGGSVKPENAVELFGQSNIDGGLIGGAALKADSFAAIIKAAV